MKLRVFILYWLPVFIYAIAIFIISSIEFKGVPGPFDVSDKLIHTIEFFILAFLCLRAFNTHKVLSRRPYYFAVMFTILYGALDELHQFFVPGRVLDFYDLVFNSVGALIVLVGKLIPYIKVRKSHNINY